MILFSLVVDKVGYKRSILTASFFQILSVVLTYFVNSYDGMWWACFFAGVGHGIVEAVINPLCISVFRDEKTKAMNILHASWPAGIVFGGTIFLLFFMGDSTVPLTWLKSKPAWLFMLIPTTAYAIMFFLCKKFPIDERVENNIPISEMFREFGGLGAALAITFIGYEFFSQLNLFNGGFGGSYTRLIISLVVGVSTGFLFGFIIKSKG